MRQSYVTYPTVLHEKDGPSISANQVLNIAPGEGQIPVSFTTEPKWEALAFPKDFPHGRGHYSDETREVSNSISYARAQLKCFDNLIFGQLMPPFRYKRISFNKKSIRTQRALRFPNGKFRDGLEWRGKRISLKLFTIFKR